MLSVKHCGGGRYNPAVREATMKPANARALNHLPVARRQIIPLYAVLGLATYNMCYFMHKYFTGSTEVNWDKKLRMTHDNQGVNPHRTAVQNKRPPPILWFGGEMMGEDGINKKQVRVFPFNYIPMAGAPSSFGTRNLRQCLMPHLETRVAHGTHATDRLQHVYVTQTSPTSAWPRWSRPRWSRCPRIEQCRGVSCLRP